ncbi:toxin-antitoxin system YwqK family antitoxin [Salegentibacter chungangensis]|uniref:Toxin-antitoxin system YwqK family antitoxin n=1 Tax=Salegentibacter chungangensis TaxID=1335724 RepID=A0ABW3NR20_9FLAO
MFKHKLNYLFLVLCLPLFAQEGINKYDEEGKRHGLWRKNFEGSDQLRFEGHFNHGEEAGDFKFYKKGFEKHPSAIISFNKDSDSVMVTYYTQEGKPISEGKMLDKKREGKWVYYHKDSDSIMMTENYVHGKLEGKQCTYFTNGKLTEKTEYKNNKKHGESFIYADNGQVIQHLHYANGELHGPATYYNASGEKLIEGQYTRDQKKGEWKYYKEEELQEKKDY